MEEKEIFSKIVEMNFFILKKNLAKNTITGYLSYLKKWATLMDTEMLGKTS
jgi:hypothetical protein